MQDQATTPPPMNWQQRLTIVLIDVLMLAELCVAMKLASEVPEAFTLTFFKTFFPMLLPTLAGGYWIMRRMRSRYATVNA